MGTSPVAFDAVPLPFLQEPVGILDYDGHEIGVWSIATTPEGEVIFLNCCGADAAVSATIKRLMRKNTGKATFRPTSGMSWSGPTTLGKLPEHYDTVTQALSYKGLRLKNQCVIPDCANIAAGLARPMETFAVKAPERPVEDEIEADEAGEPVETDESEGKRPRETFRYVLGDIRSDRPPAGTLFAHLKSLVVVAHPSWEPVLWQAAFARGLLVAQPALGIRAWSIPRDRKRWTDLVGELWMTEQLSRPEPPMMLPGKGARRFHRSMGAGK